VNDGPLTKEKLLAAMKALGDQPYIAKPVTLIMHPRKLEEAQSAADGAAHTARWLWRLCDELPWWAWVRRGQLRRAGIERADFAEMMWATFGMGDKS
jgi:hypothetical protein